MVFGTRVLGFGSLGSALYGSGLMARVSALGSSDSDLGINICKVGVVRVRVLGLGYSGLGCLG